MINVERAKRIMPLFLTFLKIGAFTFGGGYAMIPLIQREVSEKKKWISGQDILDVVSIAESTPGPIAVNAATFVGLKVAGFWGAFFATLGVVLPSFIVVSVLSFVLDRVQDLKVVKWAFEGVRVGVLALIMRAAISMFRQCKKDAVSIALMFTALVCVAFWHSSVLVVIICSGLAGLIFSAVAERRAG